jgi:chromosome segregation ATPase
MSESSPVEKDIIIGQIFQSDQLELDSIRRMYESEHKRCGELENELNKLAQKHLIQWNNAKYWKEKSLQLKLDLGIAEYDLADLRGEKSHKENNELKQTKTKMDELEAKIKDLLESHSSQLLEKETEIKNTIDQKNEVIERIKGAVERLNDRLDEQKWESKIIENILSLPDISWMMRLVSTAQFKVQQKYFSDLAKRQNNENQTSSSDGCSSTSSNEELNTKSQTLPQQPFIMGMAPMMFPQQPIFPPMQLGPMFNQPAQQNSSSAQITVIEDKKIIRED